MCWSGEASAAIAVVGLSSAYLLKKKGEKKEIYIPTAYFVLMEGLQALTYLVVNQCGNEYNVLFTRLAILHIAFQPFFINMLGMAFIKPEIKQRIKKRVYILSGIVAAAIIWRLVPMYETFGHCEAGSALCSHVRTCSVSGSWHIAWDVMLNGFGPYWMFYIFGGFLLPLFYGSWRWVLYHFIVGPVMASFSTSNPNEMPAVWCLFSTMIIALMVNTRIRKFIYVKSWFLWKYMGETKTIENKEG